MTYKPSNPNGQATSANSEPVVIASDQSSIPVIVANTAALSVLIAGEQDAVPVLIAAEQTAVPVAIGAGTATIGRLVQSTVRIVVVASGLTTAPPAYTTGDQLGAELTFANAASTAGWGGIVIGAALLDAGLKVNTGDVDLYLFSAASSPAPDNAPAEWSAASMGNFVGIVRFPAGDWRTTASNAVNSQQSLSIGYGCAATSLYGALVTRQDNAAFATAADLRVILHVVRD